MGAGGSGGEIGGVRVFKVHPGSPAAEAGLEVFFDIILEVNGTVMDPDNQHGFATKIKECENSVAKLKVHSCRAHSAREAVVMPRAWAGSGVLGATVRYDTVDPTECHGIRVLEVFPNSPAAHAGLVPFQDFMLGTGTAIFHDIDELAEHVQANLNQKMSVYTYNSDSEAVREICLVPNNDWGGDGCIGCDIGTGLLHRIPTARRVPGGPSAGVAVTAPTSLGAGGALPPAQPPTQLPPGVALPPAGALSSTGLPPSAVYPPGVAPPPATQTSASAATGGAQGSSPTLPPGPHAVAPGALSQGLPAAGVPPPLTQEGVSQLQAQLQQLGGAAAQAPAAEAAPAAQAVPAAEAPPAAVPVL